MKDQSFRTYSVYKNEMIETDDMAKIMNLKAMVEQWDLDFNQKITRMLELADITMTRQAWNHFGGNNGANVLLAKLKGIKEQFNSVKLCLEDDAIEAIIFDQKRAK